MGYHVSILRSEAGRPRPIGRDELVHLLSLRDDLEYREDALGLLLIRNQFDPPDGPLLLFQDGEVWTKNPDAATLQLMIDLASGLDARVRGDQLESYRTPEDTYVHPDDAAEVRLAGERRERLARRVRVRPWILRLSGVGIAFLVGSIYYLCSQS